MVEFEGHEGQFPSHLVDIHEQWLSISELEDEKALELANPGEKIRVIISQDIGTIEFYTTITQPRNKDGKIWYNLSFPDSLVYVERREAKRIVLDFCDKIPVTFMLGNEMVDNAYLFDISAANLGFRVVEKDVTRFLKVDDSIQELGFKHQTYACQNLKIAVKRVSYDKESQLSTIAGTFVNLSEEQSSQLNDCLAQLEEEKKNQPKKETKAK